MKHIAIIYIICCAIMAVLYYRYDHTLLRCAFVVIVNTAIIMGFIAVVLVCIAFCIAFASYCFEMFL